MIICNESILTLVHPPDSLTMATLSPEGTEYVGKWYFQHPMIGKTYLPRMVIFQELPWEMNNG